MVMTAGPVQTDSPYHEAWILKRNVMVQMALIGPAQQWYSHLPLEIKKRFVKRRVRSHEVIGWTRFQPTALTIKKQIFNHLLALQPHCNVDLLSPTKLKDSLLSQNSLFMYFLKMIFFFLSSDIFYYLDSVLLLQK